MKMTVQPRSTHHLSLRNRLSIQFRSLLSDLRNKVCLTIHFFYLLNDLHNIVCLSRETRLLYQQHLSSTEVYPYRQRQKINLLGGLSSIIILLHDDLPG